MKKSDLAQNFDFFTWLLSATAAILKNLAAIITPDRINLFRRKLGETRLPDE